MDLNLLNLHQSPICNVYAEEGSQILCVRWHSLSRLDLVFEECEAISRIVSDLHMTKLYAVQDSVRTVNAAVYDYFKETWFPQLEQLGLRQMGIPIALDPFVKATKSKVDHAGSGELEIYVFSFDEDCRAWLGIPAHVKIDHQIIDIVSAYQMLNLESEVKALDPVNFDVDIQSVREMNTNRDVAGLVELLKSKMVYLHDVESFDFCHSLATMRDIGVIMGSIKRHGVEPLQEVPALEPVLIRLGQKTNLPPRDTLIHFTLWNPEGERLRQYTLLPDEIGLVDSVRIAFPALESAIDHLIQLHHTPMESKMFTELCKKAQKKFQSVIEGLVLAYRVIDPEVFAKELRFYVDPIHVDGRDIIGPGAVEMPLFVYDHLLWSSTVRDVPYVEFKTTYLPFNLPFIREIYKYYDNRPSLVDLAVTKLAGEPNDQVVASAKMLDKLMQQLRSFRLPHKSLAQKSYDHQEETGKGKGSGGYSTDILLHILELGDERGKRLKEAIAGVNQQTLVRQESSI